MNIFYFLNSFLAPSHPLPPPLIPHTPTPRKNTPKLAVIAIISGANFFFKKFVGIALIFALVREGLKEYAQFPQFRSPAIEEQLLQ